MTEKTGNVLAMNSRTLTPGPSLPAKLSALVLSGEREIVGREDAKLLAAFSDLPDPPLATQDQVETMIGKLAIATAQPKVSQAEADERLEMYWLALRDIPVDDLRAAFLELLRTSKFMPTPAEVRAEASKHSAKRKYAKSRARHLAWLHDQEWRPAYPRITQDEIDAMKADIAGKLKANR